MGDGFTCTCGIISRKFISLFLMYHLSNLTYDRDFSWYWAFCSFLLSKESQSSKLKCVSLFVFSPPWCYSRVPLIWSCTRIYQSSPRLRRVSPRIATQKTGVNNISRFILLAVSFGSWSLNYNICRPPRPQLPSDPYYDDPFLKEHYRRNRLTCHLAQTTTAVAAAAW